MSAPIGVDRFVIRATRERGVGVPSSRSLATTSREANPVYGGCLRMGMAPSIDSGIVAEMDARSKPGLKDPFELNAPVHLKYATDVKRMPQAAE